MFDFQQKKCYITLEYKGPFTLGVIPAVYRAVLRTCPISALLFISA